MPRKRKTLPKDWEQIIAAGDFEHFKQVFELCEIKAYSGSRHNALYFPGLTEEMVCWLLEQGLNINTRDRAGRTPLHSQAADPHGTVTLYLKLGADLNAVDNYKETPLHRAAVHYHIDHVRTLLEHGANARIRDKIHKNNPLEAMLSQCLNSQIRQAAEISELFLHCGLSISDRMKESVIRIGKTFEFYREDFNKDYLEETDAALNRLYQLFGVEPIKRRQQYDGQSPITVQAAAWQTQHNELWNLLVPGVGKAQTVQGELIRITGKISHELIDNGGLNWNRSFRSMAGTIADYVRLGTPLEETAQQEIAALTRHLCANSGREEPLRLCELAVQWVLKNPMPILLEEYAEDESGRCKK